MRSAPGCSSMVASACKICTRRSPGLGRLRIGTSGTVIPGWEVSASGAKSDIVDWKERCVKRLGTCTNDSLTGERRFSGGKVRVFQFQHKTGPQATRAGCVVLGIAQIKTDFMDFCYFTSNSQIRVIALNCRALHRVKPVKTASGLSIDVALNCGDTGLQHRKRSRYLRFTNQTASMRPNHGAECLLSQNLQQHGVRHTPVNDVNGVHAAFGCIQCACNFGQHAA